MRIGDNRNGGDVVLKVDVETFASIGWIGINSIAVMNDLSMNFRNCEVRCMVSITVCVVATYSVTSVVLSSGCRVRCNIVFRYAVLIL